MAPVHVGLLVNMMEAVYDEYPGVGLPLAFLEVRRHRPLPDSGVFRKKTHDRSIPEFLARYEIASSNLAWCRSLEAKVQQGKAIAELCGGASLEKLHRVTAPTSSTPRLLLAL